MRTHDELRRLLLEGAEDSDVDAHLAACPDCADLARRLATVDAHARAINTPPVPRDLVEAVLKQASHGAGSGGQIVTLHPLEGGIDPIGPSPRRRRRLVTVVLGAATAALVVAVLLVQRSGDDPKALVGPTDPEEPTLIFSVTRESIAAPAGVKPSARKEFVEARWVEGRRRIEGGEELSIQTATSDPSESWWRGVERWTDEGIVTLEENGCRFEPPVVDVRFPLKVETYDVQSFHTACSPDVEFRVERSVVDRGSIEAAGRTWPAWKIESKITTSDESKNVGVRSFESSGWFSRDLEAYVSVNEVIELPTGEVRRRTAKLRDVTTEPFEVERPDPNKRTGRDIQIETGETDGHRWEVYAHRSEGGLCLGMRTRGSAGPSRQSCGPVGSYLSGDWMEHPAREGEDRYAYGAVREGVDAVRIEFEDGTTMEARPSGSRPSLSVRFYVVVLPERSLPVAVVALGADGAEVARQTHPSTWPVTEERLRPRTFVDRGSSRGQEWELYASALPDGEVCTELVFDGGGGGGSCGPRDPDEHDVWFPGSSSGSGTDLRTFVGEVSRRVELVMVEIEGRDDLEVEAVGSGSGMPVDFYVFALPKEWKIIRVVAFDSAGSEIERVNAPRVSF